MYSINYVYKKTHCSEYLTDDKGQPLAFDSIIEADDYIASIATADAEINGSFHIIEQYNH